MSTSLGSEGGGGGWEEEATEGQFPDDEPPFKRSRKRTKQGVYTSDITLDDLAAHFHQPASKACQELGMGLTIFKRVCRKLGLQRWPYEKPCKGDGERTSGAARAGGTPRGTGSWHLPPVTQAWAGGARAGNHAAAPIGSRASSGQASGQELAAAAAQMEGALQQQDKRVRSAAIQHLAELLVKDSEAAEELLAAIGAAVQQQQQQQPLLPVMPPQEGQQQQQQQQQQQEQEQEAGQPLPQPLLPQGLLAPPAALQGPSQQQQVQPPQPGPQMPALQPLPQAAQHSQVPAQQKGAVEQLLAALQDAPPPSSRPMGMLLQQPALPLNLASLAPAPAQQTLPLPAMLQLGPQPPPALQQQDDLAAMLDVLRSALELQAGAGAQLGSGPTSSVAPQSQQAKAPPQQLQSAAGQGGPDQVTPLLQELLSWGQPQLPLKQEQPAVGSQPAAPQVLASVAALHAPALLAKQQQQQTQQPMRPHAQRPMPADSIGSPTKPQARQQAMAMELVVAAAQGQASSQAVQQLQPGAPLADAGLSAAELGLLAAIQQASAKAAAPGGGGTSPRQAEHAGRAAPQPTAP